MSGQRPALLRGLTWAADDARDRRRPVLTYLERAAALNSEEKQHVQSWALTFSATLASTRRTTEPVQLLGFINHLDQDARVGSTRVYLTGVDLRPLASHLCPQPVERYRALVRLFATALTAADARFSVHTGVITPKDLEE